MGAKISCPKAAFPLDPTLHAFVTSIALKGFILTRHWQDSPAGTEIAKAFIVVSRFGFVA